MREAFRGMGGGRDAAAGDGGNDAATGDGGRDAGAPDGGGDAAAEAGAADAGTAASAEAGSIAAIVGDPGHSWLMYKLLMAAPPACSSTPGAAACDGGAGDAASYYTVSCGTDAAPCPQPLPDGERAILANMVIGREMPYPIGIASGTANPQAMTTSELELVSLWIAQGARVSTSCQ